MRVRRAGRRWTCLTAQSLREAAGCCLASVLWLAASVGLAFSSLRWFESAAVLGAAAAALARLVLGRGWWRW